MIVGFRWVASIGLMLDFIGVILLGIDLVRLQHTVRTKAAADRSTIEDLADQYGGTESWAAAIAKQSSWIPESAYWDYHAEDEISFNARNLAERLEETNNCVAGLAKHVSEFAIFLDRSAAENEKAASTSYVVSIVGLLFVVIGFGLQIVGQWPR